ncbi:MAG: hypothetical protein AMJ62_11925 [Myxococcales bacterium SG8_38]|nr:MAG: hypothetical protein AMJ62_11925 [Myxococcales bacterium SG8_38]
MLHPEPVACWSGPRPWDIVPAAMARPLLCSVILAFLSIAGCGDDRPPGMAGNESSLVGGPCAVRTECDELLCQMGNRFPGGVCTISCGDTSMCPRGSSCAASNQGWICLVDCATSEDCRTGWECEAVVEAPPPQSGESPNLVSVCIGPEETS